MAYTYVLRENEPFPEIYTNEQQAFDEITNSNKVAVYKGKLTPTIIQAYLDINEPFEFLDEQEQQDAIESFLTHEDMIESIARKHIIGELKYMLREEATPADAHPNDSDSHTAVFENWWTNFVNEEAFEALDEQLLDNIYNEIESDLLDITSTTWNDVQNEIGNPALASDEEIKSQIEKLEEHEVEAQEPK